MNTTHDAQAPAEVTRQSDRLYHDLLSPRETQEIRAWSRDLARRVVAPRARAIGSGDERTDGFPRDVFDALAAEGLFQVPFPQDAGGRGLEFAATATATAVEEIAYYSNSVAAVFDVHCILAGNALNQGTPEQRQRWLEPLVSGSIVGAFATSEPASSTDLSPQAVQTVATRTETGWSLSGRKRWITNSPVADVVVVLARTGERLSLFIVDTTLPGVTIGTPDRKLGNRGQLTADVVLEEVELGAADVLGEVGQGLRIALSTLTYGRIGIGAAGVGMAQAAFDHMVDRLTHRHAFGAPLGSNQHWQFLIADYATRIETARSLYLKAALLLDAGNPFPEPEAAMAKEQGTSLAVDIARDGIQAFGGLGFVTDLGADGSSSPIETIYRDSKIGEIYEGANEIQKWVIARHVFGRQITG